jgi:hypothetical protein
MPWLAGLAYAAASFIGGAYLSDASWRSRVLMSAAVGVWIALSNALTRRRPTLRWLPVAVAVSLFVGWAYVSDRQKQAIDVELICRQADAPATSVEDLTRIRDVIRGEYADVRGNYVPKGAAAVRRFTASAALMAAADDAVAPFRVPAAAGSPTASPDTTQVRTRQQELAAACA